jgi:hypothetical protein
VWPACVLGRVGMPAADGRSLSTADESERDAHVFENIMV